MDKGKENTHVTPEHHFLRAISVLTHSLRRSRQVACRAPKRAFHGACAIGKVPRKRHFFKKETQLLPSCKRTSGKPPFIKFYATVRYVCVCVCVYLPSYMRPDWITAAACFLPPFLHDQFLSSEVCLIYHLSLLK